jgi:hypothetical protein
VRTLALAPTGATPTDAVWFGPRPATVEQLTLLRKLARTAADVVRVEAAISAWPPLTTGDAFELIDELEGSRRRGPRVEPTTSTTPAPIREAAVPAAPELRCEPSDASLGNREDLLPPSVAGARYRLLDELRELSPELGACGRRPVGQAGIYRWADGHHGISCVMRCGRIHVCPVCAAHRRRQRMEELSTAIERHTEAGGGVALVTLTYSHRHGDGVALADALPSLRRAWRSLTSGRASARERDAYGCHTVRSLDLTYGRRNGWHPHWHVLVLTDRVLTPAEHDELQAAWAVRWRGAVVRSGLGEPSDENGVVWQPLAGTAHDVTSAARYLVKGGALERVGAAAELARTDLKQGRSGGFAPFELAAIATDIETAPTMTRARARMLWLEYTAAIHGERALVFSRGLRQRLGMTGEPEDGEPISDNDTAGSVLVLPLSIDDLKVLAATGRTGRVLTAASVGGEPAARRELERAHALSGSDPPTRAPSQRAQDERGSPRCSTTP